MVRADKNWADICGAVREVSPDPDRPGWVLAAVDLASAAPVDGYRNMLAAWVGSRVDIAIRADEAAAIGVTAGATLRARVRLERPRLVFAESGSCSLEDTAAGG